MKLRYIIPLLLFSLNCSASATPVPSVLSTLDAEQLLDQCGAAITWYNGNTQQINPEQMAQAIECKSYVAGAIDQLQLMLSFTLSQREYECYKQTYAGVSLVQFIRVIYKYLSSHPESLNHDAAYLVYVAVVNAFPIPKDCGDKPS